MDVILVCILVLGGFIAYEIYTGEASMRWIGSIKRTRSPIVYWLIEIFYIAILAVLVYAWVDGLRVPFSGLFK
ncbi:MAG: hypothetical protein U0Z26_04085 [Anaerolineales bacterium]